MKRLIFKVQLTSRNTYGIQFEIVKASMRH